MKKEDGVRNHGNGKAAAAAAMLRRAGGTGTAVLVTCAGAWAQTATETATAMAPRARDLPGGILSTLLFGLVGIILAIIGFKLFDLAVRHNIEQEIFEKNNMAAAILAGFVVLGVSLIVGATILSD